MKTCHVGTTERRLMLFAGRSNPQLGEAIATTIRGGATPGAKAAGLALAAHSTLTPVRPILLGLATAGALVGDPKAGAP